MSESRACPCVRSLRRRIRSAVALSAVLAALATATAAPAEAAVEIEPEPGFVATWNGNDGDQFDPAAEARAPSNLALATEGAAAFSSGDLGPSLGLPFHIAQNINDGCYGNNKAWIGADFAAAPFLVGVAFGASRSVRAVAWGRDNGNDATDPCGGSCTDRCLGVYTLQFTQDAVPASTSAWTTVARFDYQSSDDLEPREGFTAHLRHEFVVGTVDGNALQATGIRLLVPATGLAVGTAVDELEAYSTPFSPPPPPVERLAIAPAAGFEVTWDGNDGLGFDASPPPAGSRAPDNLAMASHGAVAFSSGDLGPQLGISFHVAANANDGFYGHGNSWIGGDGTPAPPHIGVRLAAAAAIGRIAWGRDNGNVATDPCGGSCTDRALGEYVVQITTDASPSPTSVWTTVATIVYLSSLDDGTGGGFSAHLRHEFAVATSGGAPLMATGVRLLVPSSGIAAGTAVDELEVYPAVVPAARLLRGDCNDDGGVDISDALCILGWLFLGTPPPSCPATTDTNGDGEADISDAVRILGYLFLGGHPPVAPFPSCGPVALEPGGALGCSSAAICP